MGAGAHRTTGSAGGPAAQVAVPGPSLSELPVLLVDEPTSHLDAATAGAVLSTVLEYAERRSLLWVTPPAG